MQKSSAQNYIGALYWGLFQVQKLMKKTWFRRFSLKTPCFIPPKGQFWLFRGFWPYFWVKIGVLLSVRTCQTAQNDPVLDQVWKGSAWSGGSKRRTCRNFGHGLSHPSQKRWDFGAFGHLSLLRWHLKWHLKTPNLGKTGVKILTKNRGVLKKGQKTR